MSFNLSLYSQTKLLCRNQKIVYLIVFFSSSPVFASPPPPPPPHGAMCVQRAVINWPRIVTYVFPKPHRSLKFAEWLRCFSCTISGTFVSWVFLLLPEAREITEWFHCNSPAHFLSVQNKEDMLKHWRRRSQETFGCVRFCFSRGTFSSFSNPLSLNMVEIMKLVFEGMKI